MKTNCYCCAKKLPITKQKVCPECGHVFSGNGWDGIDAHWKAKHSKIMPYEKLWDGLCDAHRGKDKLPKNKISRKKFILSHGATCNNWNWSWSFVNHQKKFVIFGAWDKHTSGNMTMILNEDWAIRKITGKKSLGYKQSREHIRLIEEDGYQLMTFPMIYSREKQDKNEMGPAVIKDFVSKIEAKTLVRIGIAWYATDGAIPDSIPEEVDINEKHIEGAVSSVTVNSYERNPKARKACIDHYGAICVVCNFDFKTFYGDMGKGYIHVHHIIPMSSIKKAYEVDPINDLRPVCPNCHAMIHRPSEILSIDELREIINK